ncbi:4-hydroxythreonine-4-phosphate dehydrogenase PdxA [Oleispirillum naphthae]|uniref:4-hydroxythreonine-4-phosphate dehydrogenase PdxA n=1 Tax=Oleispirillum naphthae TaxID=2838853 RepID=UPI003082579F
MTAPPLALSMGEPAGIGPDLILEAWRRARGGAIPAFAAIADPAVLAARARRLGLSLPIRPIAALAEAAEVFSAALPVLPVTAANPEVIGVPDPANAAAVTGAIRRGVELCQAGEAAALVTAPIHKAALAAAGFPHPGHTDYLAELAGPGCRAVMMLACDALRVVPATVHCALAEVPARLAALPLAEIARIVLAALARDFGIAQPRLAVAALNPHAGEDGLMGDEEEDLIAPAIAALAAEGHAVAGPFPADTLFHAEARALYDAALCMYHDQALIPIKTLDFHGGVNVTLGLPFIRTSPDHGTALSLAGTGQARPDSLIAALRMADAMARARAGAA